LATIQEEAGPESEYSCVAATSNCRVTSLNFVEKEDDAYKGANEALNNTIKSNGSPTFVLLNSSTPTMILRRKMPSFGIAPVISLPFPPGPDHNPTISTLPSLRWETPIVRLSLEAYLYMGVVSYPKRVECSRYGNLPIGNLGGEESFTLYDVTMTRMLQKNRAISWASTVQGQPDLGASLFPSSDGNSTMSVQISTSSDLNSEDIWSDDNELVSPVVRRPGSYRSLCIDIDLHDLAIAALTDPSSLSTSNALFNDPSSPASVMQLDGTGGSFKFSEPLGDEMSTVTSLPMLRALVLAWLRDAFESNSEIADSMLHHVYRLVSSPDVLLHDPALHRAVHSLMKGTFVRLLGELQRLGCSIVHATFQKITVSTNKTCLADAEEYINFVISTIRNQIGENGDGSGLARVSLMPRQFHTQFIFLDEYNFGTLYLDRHDRDSEEITQADFVLEEDSSEDTVVVPSVIENWSLINYIGSDIAQQYFRVIIARFSRDILRKEEDLRKKGGSKALPSLFDKDLHGKLFDFKKRMISKTFAAALTSAVGEIGKEMEERKNDNDTQYRTMLLMKTDHPLNPLLEFVKSVIVVLELDKEVDAEVHALKRSLLAQIGVAEYSSMAKWENPCPTLMLPDCYCKECQETRDVNLCYLPPTDGDDARNIHWFCEDCGTEYDVTSIERRLIEIAHKNVLRYQLQDLRCSKTNRVATNYLSQVSHCSAGLKLDISPQDGRSTIETLHRLAKYHELEELQWTTEGLLHSFQN
jgi:DNA polymerase epsilon subunit 1